MSIEDVVQQVADESERIRDLDPAALANHGQRSPHAASRMLSLRLPTDVIADLEQVGARLNIPVSALVRGYVLQGLAKDSASVSVAQTLERISRDLDRVRRMLMGDG